MKVIISKIYDKQRFKWFVHLKYGFSLDYSTTLSKIIDEDNKFILDHLTEAEVRYLQTTSSCRYNHEYICKLKVINLSKMSQVRKQNIPPYLDNERKSCIDISPQPGDEPKQETLDLFHVKFTKVIHFDEMLNERQIQALLKDKHDKSINIDK